ncbi:MAG: prolipoprotein diacylglyceryl transferase [Planctomycetota bacterium]
MIELADAALVLAQTDADLGGFMPRIGPFVIKFTESFGIRWYGLSYVTGFVLAWLVLKLLAKRGLVRIPADRVGEAIVIIVMGVLIGGRLGYCLFYRPSLLWSFDGAVPFWGLLKIHEGGMASHGGMIGVAVASWWVSRGFKPEDATGNVNAEDRIGRCPTLHVTDALALVAPIGLFLGRLANFINGELLGKIVAAPGERAPGWAVRFPQEHLDASHAPQLTAVQEQELLNLLEETVPTAPTFEMAYGRLLERVWSGDQDVIARLEPLLSARHPSQLYQAVAEGLMVGAVAWAVFRSPRRPGVITASFLMVYGALRIVTEFFRLPDGHFDGGGTFDITSPRPLGLSRGQWLSALMVVIGVALLVWVTRRGGEKLGGWGKRAPLVVARGVTEARDSESTYIDAD